MSLCHITVYCTSCTLHNYAIKLLFPSPYFLCRELLSSFPQLLYHSFFLSHTFPPLSSSPHVHTGVIHMHLTQYPFDLNKLSLILKLPPSLTCMNYHFMSASQMFVLTALPSPIKSLELWPWPSEHSAERKAAVALSDEYFIVVTFCVAERFSARPKNTKQHWI